MYTVIVTYRAGQKRVSDPQGYIESALNKYDLSHYTEQDGTDVELPQGTYFGKCEGESVGEVAAKISQCVEDADNAANARGRHFVFVVESEGAMKSLTGG